jgi:hypothetical protein
MLFNQSSRRKKAGKKRAGKKRAENTIEVPETIEVEQETTLKERILGGLRWLNVKLKM